MFDYRTRPRSELARALKRLLVQSGLVLLLARSAVLHAGPINVPNGSLETPATFFVSTLIESWQRTPQPQWWNENATGPWTNLVGIFKNTPVSDPDHIFNCDSNQAAWLFANPEVGIFQDYESMDWNDSTPTHAFNATYEPGKSYRMTVGLAVGTNAGPPMLEGVTLALSLYYLDPFTNRVVLATTEVTNTHTVFSNANYLIDYSVEVPVVRNEDAWTGRHIGILLRSTVSTNLVGGYWDFDNVRLMSTLSPTLLNPVYTNNQFQFVVQSEPGLPLEILASTNVTLSIGSWTSLGVLTNVTGSIPFIDTSTNFQQRFYQARLLP